MLYDVTFVTESGSCYTYFFDQFAPGAVFLVNELREQEKTTYTILTDITLKGGLYSHRILAKAFISVEWPWVVCEVL